MAHAEPTQPLLVHFPVPSREKLQEVKQEHNLSETKLTILAVDYVLSNPKVLERLLKEVTK